jgi:hypothetical protein
LNGANWKITKAIAVENPLLMNRFESELKILETRMKEKPELYNKHTWKVKKSPKNVIK